MLLVDVLLCLTVLIETTVIIVLLCVSKKIRLPGRPRGIPFEGILTTEHGRSVFVSTKGADLIKFTADSSMYRLGTTYLYVYRDYGSVGASFRTKYAVEDWLIRHCTGAEAVTLLEAYCDVKVPILGDTP